MKKVLAGLLSCLLLFGCAGGHSITIVSGEQYVEKAPKKAKAGETVTITTLMVTDADLYVNVNGVEVTKVREGVYEFVMPDADVEVKVTVIANGLA